MSGRISSQDRHQRVRKSTLVVRNSRKEVSAQQLKTSLGYTLRMGQHRHRTDVHRPLLMLTLLRKLRITNSRLQRRGKARVASFSGMVATRKSQRYCRPSSLNLTTLLGFVRSVDLDVPSLDVSMRLSCIHIAITKRDRPFQLVLEYLAH